MSNKTNVSKPSRKEVLVSVKASVATNGNGSGSLVEGRRRVYRCSSSSGIGFSVC